MIATSMCLKLAAAAAIALSVAHGTTGAGSPVSGDASAGAATRLDSDATISSGAGLSTASAVASVHGSTTATASLPTSPVSGGAGVAARVFAGLRLR